MRKSIQLFCKNDKIHFGSGVYHATQQQLVQSNKENNITLNIAGFVGKNLHNLENHPICILKELIHIHFHNSPWNPKKFDNFLPILYAKDAFDSLLIPTDHVCRSKSDTFYYDSDRILRCQGTAHQPQMLQEGCLDYLVTCDVYRRDQVDSTHFPVFHQMDGGRVLETTNIDYLVEDLKQTLSSLCFSLFGNTTEIRWNSDSFPFTDPSFELEIYHKGAWIEVLGCGIIRKPILETNLQVQPGREYNGWAFGLGLERLAMILFEIPDVRLFWSSDERFTSQFSKEKINKFKPFSKYPPVFKDISFYLPEKHEINDFHELVRELGGDLIEKVEIVDEFFNQKISKLSQCFRITYRSMERSLTDDEINNIQNEVSNQVNTKLGYEVR